MRFSRFIGYFSQLRAVIGTNAAFRFVIAHFRNTLRPPHEGALAHVPVGPYIFYFPSLEYFVGLFTEIFFKETYYLEATQEPLQVIDCGANIGMSLLYIKIRAPRAHVLCFEPNPAARAVLEKNIEANGWGSEVRVLPYALGKEKGTAEFFVDEGEATSSGGSIGNHQKNRDRSLTSYPVEVDVLSRYIDRTIDLLKIDIEGPEFDVLEELIAAKALRNVALIQLEYHYIPGSFTRPLSQMLALLESEGFHTFVESNAAPHTVLGQGGWHTYMVFAWR